MEGDFIIHPARTNYGKCFIKHFCALCAFNSERLLFFNICNAKSEGGKQTPV